MTENEARKKWCPHVRLWQLSGNGGDTAYNRIESEMGTNINPINSRCVASDCMMWRNNEVGDNTGFCGLGGDIGRIR